MGVETQTPAPPSRAGSKTTLAAWARSFLLAGLLSLLTNAVACAAFYAVAAPKLISLLIEPISLLLLPASVFMMSIEHGHDVVGDQILWASLAFYWVFFLGLLRLLARRRHT